jgi:hypothetical protein
MFSFTLLPFHPLGKQPLLDHITHSLVDILSYPGSLREYNVILYVELNLYLVECGLLG